jgi:hypothetical protein
MNSVANPSDFIGVSIQYQIIVEVVLTFQMTQTTCHVESKVEIIFVIGHFDLAPRMTIIFSIHFLHLTKMAIWIINQWEFKENIPIKHW